MKYTATAARPTLAALYAELNAQLWEGQLPSTIKAGIYGDGTARKVQVRRIGLSIDRVLFGQVKGLRAHKKTQHAIGRFLSPGEGKGRRIPRHTRDRRDTCPGSMKQAAA